MKDSAKKALATCETMNAQGLFTDSLQAASATVIMLGAIVETLDEINATLRDLVELSKPTP